MKPNPSSAPTTYVCLLSDYTVGSAQAVNELRPARVIAISSKFVAEKKGEDRFRRLVESWKIPLAVVGSEDGKPFPAESYNASRVWLTESLLPLLKREQAAGARLLANLTGGTKAAAIALKECWPWEGLHYTAEGSRNKLETFAGDTVDLSPLDLLDEAGLLLDNLTIAPPEWQDIASNLLAPAAARLLEDYSHDPRNSAMHRHDEPLRALWFPKAAVAKFLDRHGVRVQGNIAILPPGPLATFFAEIGSLACDEVGPMPDGGWRLPLDNRHPWARFVAGGWWEFLVAEWLRKADFDFVPHVVVPRRFKGPEDSEADILVRSRRGVFCAIECKVQPPGCAGFGDMVKLLQELGDRFGKTRKGFAVSPAFWWRVNESARRDFEDACGLRNIDLLDSREAIADWLS